MEPSNLGVLVSVASKSKQLESDRFIDQCQFPQAFKERTPPLSQISCNTLQGQLPQKKVTQETNKTNIQPAYIPNYAKDDENQNQQALSKQKAEQEGNKTCRTQVYNERRPFSQQDKQQITQQEPQTGLIQKELNFDSHLINSNRESFKENLQGQTYPQNYDFANIDLPTSNRSHGTHNPLTRGNETSLECPGQENRYKDGNNMIEYEVQGNRQAYYALEYDSHDDSSRINFKREGIEEVNQFEGSWVKKRESPEIENQQYIFKKGFPISDQFPFLPFNHPTEFGQQSEFYYSYCDNIKGQDQVIDNSSQYFQPNFHNIGIQADQQYPQYNESTKGQQVQQSGYNLQHQPWVIETTQKQAQHHSSKNPSYLFETPNKQTEQQQISPYSLYHQQQFKEGYLHDKIEENERSQERKLCLPSDNQIKDETNGYFYHFDYQNKLLPSMDHQRTYTLDDENYFHNSAGSNPLDRITQYHHFQQSASADHEYQKDLNENTSAPPHFFQFESNQPGHIVAGQLIENNNEQLIQEYHEEVSLQFNKLRNYPNNEPDPILTSQFNQQSNLPHNNKGTHLPSDIPNNYQNLNQNNIVEVSYTNFISNPIPNNIESINSIDLNQQKGMEQSIELSITSSSRNQNPSQIDHLRMKGENIVSQPTQLFDHQLNYTNKRNTIDSCQVQQVNEPIESILNLFSKKQVIKQLPSEVLLEALSDFDEKSMQTRRNTVSSSTASTFCITIDQQKDFEDAVPEKSTSLKQKERRNPNKDTILISQKKRTLKSDVTNNNKLDEQFHKFQISFNSNFEESDSNYDEKDDDDSYSAGAKSKYKKKSKKLKKISRKSLINQDHLCPQPTLPNTTLWCPLKPSGIPLKECEQGMYIDPKIKFDTKNLVKNFLNQFLSFVNSVEEETRICQLLELKSNQLLIEYQEKLKVFFKNKKFNRGLLKEFISNLSYRKLFAYFLEHRANDWIQFGRMKDKPSHFRALSNFIYICENHNEIKSWRFRYNFV